MKDIERTCEKMPLNKYVQERKERYKCFTVIPDNSQSASSFKNNPFSFLYAWDKLVVALNKEHITHNSSFLRSGSIGTKESSLCQRSANRVEIHFLVARVSTFSNTGNIPTATAAAAQINAHPGQLPAIIVVIRRYNLQHMWQKNTLTTVIDGWKHLQLGHEYNKIKTD